MSKQSNRLIRQVVVPLVSIVIFLILWELLVWWRDWPNYKMASPSDLTADEIELLGVLHPRR